MCVEQIHDELVWELAPVEELPDEAREQAHQTTPALGFQRDSYHCYQTTCYRRCVDETDQGRLTGSSNESDGNETKVSNQ